MIGQLLAHIAKSLCEGALAWSEAGLVCIQPSKERQHADADAASDLQAKAGSGQCCNTAEQEEHTTEGSKAGHGPCRQICILPPLEHHGGEDTCIWLLLEQPQEQMASSGMVRGECVLQHTAQGQENLAAGI